jgi:hypothetical protein
MATIGHKTNPADTRRRRIRATQLLFAGAATGAALALFGPSRPADTSTVGASGQPATATFATDDTNFVNDQGQTSGDIFTQNAQDQSSP